VVGTPRTVWPAAVASDAPDAEGFETPARPGRALPGCPGPVQPGGNGRHGALDRRWRHDQRAGAGPEAQGAAGDMSHGGTGHRSAGAVPARVTSSKPMARHTLVRDVNWQEGLCSQNWVTGAAGQRPYQRTCDKVRASHHLRSTCG